MSSPWVALAISLALGIVLIVGTRRWFYILMLILLAVPGGFIALLSSICINTTLQRVDTVEFNGQVYHLTLAEDAGDILEWSRTALYLHECDQQSQNCRGQEIADSLPGELHRPEMLIEGVQNRLIVFVSGQPVFTLDTGDHLHD